MRSVIFFLAASTAIGTIARAEPGYWPAPMETVLVSAPRPSPEEILNRRPGFATLVPLGADAPATRDLSDFLDRAAGLHVHRYGGVGAYTLASVRGSTPGQVKVCLDGVPIGAAGDGSVNLALLPLASLDHAEIYRGPETASFGGAPAAGVVNLVTPGAAVAPLCVAGGIGSFDTRVLRGQWGGVLHGAGLFASAERRSSDGDYPYLDRNGTTHGNTADDREVRRANNRFEETRGLAKIALFERSGPLDYTAQVLDRRSGVPGTESIQTRHVNFDVLRARQQLSGRLSPRWCASWTTRMSAGAHHESTRERYDNREGEVGLARVRTEQRTRDQGGDIGLFTSPPRSWQRLQGRIETSSERLDPRDLLHAASGPQRSRRTLTRHLGDRCVAGRITIDAAYRWVEARDRAGGVPAVTHRHEGATWGGRVDLGRGIAIKGSRGPLIRFPTFPELYGQNGIQEGNPSLRAERGVQWDLGFTHSSKLPLRVEAAYYESLTRDQIVLLQNSQRTVKGQNLERTWVRGAEMSLFWTVELPRHVALELQGNGTSQIARDVGRSRTYRGKRVPNLPLREGYLSTTVSAFALDLRWEISARSAAYRDRYNSEAKKTTAYTVHDISVERSFFGRSTRIRAAAQNAGDARVMDLDGFPLPGRTYWMEATWTRG